MPPEPHLERADSFPWTGRLAEIAQTLADRLGRTLNADAVWMFGSVARGNNDADSDIDLVAIVPDSSHPRYRRAVEALRFVTDIRAPKDVIVLTRKEWASQARVPASLVSTILREGKLLYGR